MTNETTEQVQSNQPEASEPASESRVRTLWQALVPDHIQHIFIPEDIEKQLLPNETVEIEIHLAWYRNVVAVTLINYAAALFIATVSFSLISGMFALNFGYNVVWALMLPFILLIALVLYGLFERFQYLQWRLVKTNARIIISMPQPDAWYLVDSIELTSQPKVLDANWSNNQARRFMQALTGSRDLYISLLGLQFVEGTAKVKDAIVIPDVTEADIKKLKLAVFGS
ncbi:MAG: hypothetical protein KDE51_26435 [Anaerolineales bacterium]|nr:hypothetical protein [Anaerolineales bacterium]